MVACALCLDRVSIGWTNVQLSQAILVSLYGSWNVVKPCKTPGAYTITGSCMQCQVAGSNSMLAWYSLCWHGMRRVHLVSIMQRYTVISSPQHTVIIPGSHAGAVPLDVAWTLIATSSSCCAARDGPVGLLLHPMKLIRLSILALLDPFAGLSSWPDFALVAEDHSGVSVVPRLNSGSYTRHSREL